MSIFVSCFLFGGRRKQKPFLGYHKTYYVCYWPKSCVICTAFWILRHWLWTWRIFYGLTHYPIPFLFSKSSFQYIHCDIMKLLITTHLSRNDQHSQTKILCFSTVFVTWIHISTSILLLEMYIWKTIFVRIHWELGSNIC